MVFATALIAAIGFSLNAQSRQPATRPAAPTGAAVTYAKDVAAILHAKCISCHRPGEVAPMSLRTFDEVRPWARSIKQKVTTGEMPPWFADAAHGVFINDPRLTQAQIETIARWVDGGAVRGNPSDEPKAPELTDGWQLGEPDFILTLPEVNIPAEGRDYFPTPTLTVDIPEDRWVRALEIRPSNREVTHHTVLFATPAGGLGAAVASGFFDVLGVWAVGTPPTVYPEGMGRWLRKGQQLRTNLHYHPNGKPATDRTRVGLYWGKGELKKEVATALAGDLTFQIPPGASNHEMRAVYVIDQDSTVVSYFPHMHLRGKDMKMTATFPDGRKQTLLNVPDYDFNWQLFYYPKERVQLPRGTRIDVVAHYDNSAANPNNPDPNRAVTFGEQSTDEMMFGVFDFVADAGVAPTPATVETRMDALQSTLPADSTYRIPVSILKPIPSVLHLPRTGEGTWYLGQSRIQINVIPIRNIVWNGDEFSFRIDVRFGPKAAFTFDVTGAVSADGAISGRVVPVGVEKAPFTQKFAGARRTEVRER
jgi:mono/diheme cytochrome c family protein